jgi:hypothetical protein
VGIEGFLKSKDIEATKTSLKEAEGEVDLERWAYLLRREEGGMKVIGKRDRRSRVISLL